jgi:phage tail sheath gpL-like
MAITTLQKASLLLGNATQDDIITALIPLVEADYLNIRNKEFEVGSTITINTACTTNGNVTITWADSNFDVPVLAGDNAVTVAKKIYTYFEYYKPLVINRKINGISYYTVKLVSNVVTIITDYNVSFNGNSTGVTATASTVDIIYPDGSEMTAIKMIQHQLTNIKSQGIASESLGDYSVSYANGLMIGDYPKTVVNGIKRYATFK